MWVIVVVVAVASAAGTATARLKDRIANRRLRVILTKLYNWWCLVLLFFLILLILFVTIACGNVITIVAPMLSSSLAV